jgi:hypothetical protein
MARPKINNNPFAIMDTTPDPWKGLKGRTSDGFLIFDTPTNGVRAGFINLTNAYLKRGLNTIEKIFPVYAPSGHGANVPEDYIKRVVSLTGISRDKKLITREEIKKVGRAIIEHEEGKFWVTEKEFNDGYNAAANSSSFLAALKTGGAAVGLLLLAFFGFLFMSK